MSPYPGFSVGYQCRSKKNRNLFLNARVFVPLFFVMSGAYPVENGGVFSELAGLPATMQIEHTGVSTDASAASVQADSKHENLIRCRWRTDRIFLSSLGRKTPRDISDVGCASQEDGSVGVRNEDERIREKVISLTSGEYPLEVMAASIASYDPPIAGLLVGIAKKESDWGKHAPRLRGEECFNYWGYRGYGNRGMTEDGYGCFEKPDDAVRTIGNRLMELSSMRGGMTDPERMVVWKCGSSCGGQSPESVRKWISDVRLYYQQFAVF